MAGAKMATDEEGLQKIKAQMDEVDNKIMSILYDGGIMETEDIADRVGISIDEAERRLNKIESLGLIGDGETCQ